MKFRMMVSSDAEDDDDWDATGHKEIRINSIKLNCKCSHPNL